MTRSEMVEVLSRRQRVGRPVAEVVVDQFFSTISAALCDGVHVEIRGFGTFTARRYQGYAGRNPRTGTPIVVKPKVLPYFKVGKELKERVEEAR